MFLFSEIRPNEINPFTVFSKSFKPKFSSPCFSNPFKPIFRSPVFSNRSNPAFVHRVFKSFKSRFPSPGVAPRPQNYTEKRCATGHATQSNVTGFTNPRPKPLAGVLGMNHRHTTPRSCHKLRHRYHIYFRDRNL